MVTTTREEIVSTESIVHTIAVTETTILIPEFDMAVQISDRKGEAIDIAKTPVDMSAGVSKALNPYARWTLFLATFQQGVLTYAGIPSNGDTVTIGTKVYTYQTVLTNSDGNVAIGADQDAALSNLVAAITLGTGSGTAYAAAMTANSVVDKAVADLTANTLTAIATNAGAQSIATTETSANLSWGGANMNAVADAVNVTLELSPSGTGVAADIYYTLPESPIIFSDAGFDALEFGYDGAYIRLTGSNSVYIRAEIRGTY